MSITIQEVIDRILQTVPGAPLEGTVDTFKCGNPTQPVSGIVTTFMATRRVIDRAVELGANLIIAHEPTFFNHRDEVDWLKGDKVYETKRAALDRHNIVVWRFHDHWHMHKPDGIMTGVVRLLGWESFIERDNDYLAVIPPMPLGELIQHVKTSFEMTTLRVVGPDDMTCRRIALVPGSPPIEWQLKALRETGADTLLCGETSEWQVCEYVRDACVAGENKAQLILGHEKSEEAGMHYLVEWLQPKVPGIAITHVPSGDPIRFV